MSTAIRASLRCEAADAARNLLGCLLCRRFDGTLVRARIVEVEAYAQDDPASHSARGRTRSNASMFAVPGTAYVYRSYGVHWCLNVAVEERDRGAAVLLRAAEVVDGFDAVRARRPSARSDRDLLRGPGRLTAGLDIDGLRHDGADLTDTGGQLFLAADERSTVGRAEVRRGPRVGVSRAADVEWRFWLADNPAVSPYRRSPRAK